MDMQRFGPGSCLVASLRPRANRMGSSLSQHFLPELASHVARIRLLAQFHLPGRSLALALRSHAFSSSSVVWLSGTLPFVAALRLALHVQCGPPTCVPALLI
jgi:hypothetical protein